MSLSGPRVIIVEDEALVALMMEDLVTGLGCQVAGVFDTLAAAQSWLTGQILSPPLNLDGALLDVHLGSELVLPLADQLQERNIPFAFMTGNSQFNPGARYAGAPLLLKPINRVRLREVVRGFDR